MFALRGLLVVALGGAAPSAGGRGGTAADSDLGATAGSDSVFAGVVGGSVLTSDGALASDGVPTARTAF